MFADGDNIVRIVKIITVWFEKKNNNKTMNLKSQMYVQYNFLTVISQLNMNLKIGLIIGFSISRAPITETRWIPENNNHDDFICTTCFLYMYFEILNPFTCVSLCNGQYLVQRWKRFSLGSHPNHRYFDFLLGFSVHQIQRSNNFVTFKISFKLCWLQFFEYIDYCVQEWQNAP